MIHAFHPRAQGLALALLLIVAPVDRALADTESPGTAPARAPGDLDGAGAAGALAEQVAEIAHSAAISRAKKEKRISTSVRVAIVAATAYKSNPEGILGIALELTDAAARAAPQYADVIASAALFTPSLARLEAAPGQIRAAAFAAAKAPRAPHRRYLAQTESGSPPVAPPGDIPGATASRRVTQTAATDTADAPDTLADSSMIENRARSRDSLGENSKIDISATLSVRRDDNVYLARADKVADTIIALTPGVAYSFGQNSLAHGSVSYKNALTRYVDKSAPNVALSNGAADFGYDGANTSVAAAASFMQMNQNNSDVAALGQKAIYRRDVLALNANAETHLTAKTSVMTGVNFNRSEYKTGGLTGSQETEIPLKIYFETRPKLALSTGLSYRRVAPQNGGEKGKDFDYNLGARGEFTPKLSGQISVDYRTREVGNNPKENLWGLNGALNYEITPKTASSLVFSRDFRTGALGESLKSSNYSFRVTTDLSRQWQFGASLTYRQVEYGPLVFSLNNSITAVDRNDNYWEGDLQASYLIRSWLSASADYTIRSNHSTLAGAQFSNNLLSLMLGWRY